MVRHIVSNPNTSEADAGGATLQDHLGLHSTLQGTLGYIMILNLKNGRSGEVQKERKETLL